MLPVGITRYIDFTLSDVSSNPVTGRTLASWSIVFLRGMTACPDTLSLHEYGNGRYTVSYLPSAAGHDYLEIYDSSCDIRVIDSEDIVSPSAMVGSSSPTIYLDHNYGGTDALRLTGVDDPNTYTMYVYHVSDWEQNRHADTDAVGASNLDVNGRWLKQISVLADSYHIVAKRQREVRILRWSLEVN